MPWMPGCPSDPATPKGSLTPIAIVLHRTYGQWAGDYSVGKNQGYFQFLIGQDDGQWVQFMDTNSVAWHANGANFKAFGIELTGTNEDTLTPWQLDRLGAVLHWASTTHGIPLTYTDPSVTQPASIHVNDGNFQGVISHASVQTDDGSAQHSDLITLSDYQLATQEDNLLPDERGWLENTNNKVNDLSVNQAPKWENTNNKVNDIVVNLIPALEAQIAALEQRVATLTPSGGVDPATLEAAVTTVINRSKLTTS